MMAFKFPKEQKEEMIENIQHYFQEERSEELGHLGAEQLLDFFISQMGPSIYNQAVGECREYVRDRLAAVAEDMKAQSVFVDEGRYADIELLAEVQAILLKVDASEIRRWEQTVHAFPLLRQQLVAALPVRPIPRTAG